MYVRNEKSFTTNHFISERKKGQSYVFATSSPSSLLTFLIELSISASQATTTLWTSRARVKDIMSPLSDIWCNILYQFNIIASKLLFVFTSYTIITSMSHVIILYRYTTQWWGLHGYSTKRRSGVKLSSINSLKIWSSVLVTYLCGLSVASVIFRNSFALAVHDSPTITGGEDHLASFYNRKRSPAALSTWRIRAVSAHASLMSLCASTGRSWVRALPRIHGHECVTSDSPYAIASALTTLSGSVNLWRTDTVLRQAIFQTVSCSVSAVLAAFAKMPVRWGFEKRWQRHER